MNCFFWPRNRSSSSSDMEARKSSVKQLLARAKNTATLQRSIHNLDRQRSLWMPWPDLQRSQPLHQSQKMQRTSQTCFVVFRKQQWWEHRADGKQNIWHICQPNHPILFFYYKFTFQVSPRLSVWNCIEGRALSLLQSGMLPLVDREPSIFFLTTIPY